MQLISPDFSHNQTIPTQFTCAGANKTPRLQWSNPPANTKSFVLICEDPDAPGGSFVHWIMFDIPADKTEPVGGVSNMNDFNKKGYGGPCPPPGKPHRYIFTVYALDFTPDLRMAKAPGILQAIQGHVLGSAQLIGLFGR